MVNRANRGRDDDRGSKKKRGGFVYKPRSAEDVKKRADQSGGSFDSPWKSGIDVWRPGPGDNDIRILPPTWEDHEHYGYDVWLHSFVGADQGTFICLAKMKNEACPCCEEARELQAAGEVDEAKKLRAVKKSVCWIIDRDDKHPTPQLFAMSWTMDRDIAELCRDKKAGKVLLIDNPDVGYDVSVKRIGQGLKTKYSGLAIAREDSPISDDQDEQDEILEFIEENPIPDQLVFKDAKYMAKAMSGSAESKDRDLDDEDEPKGGKRGKRRDDDEEEEETPRRKRRDADEDEDDTPRRKRRDADEDEDEPAPKKKRRDDDEDDEPAPRRKRRDADEDEDDAPKKKRRDDDDEDDTPRRKRRDADEDEDEPKKKRKSADEDEDEDPPKRRRGSDEDDDEPAPRRRRRDDDEDDEPAPKKKGKPADDDEDDEPAPRRRRK